MNISKLAVAVAAIGFGAAPAAAVVTTFATFSAPTSSANLRFVNSGNGSTRTSDGSLYTIASATGTAPAGVAVRFSFLQSAFVTQPAVQNVTARFTLNATVAKNTPALKATLGGSTIFDQGGLSGSFSFVTTSAITVTGPNFVTHAYAAGANLLTGVFTGADLTGKIGGSAGAVDASTLGGATITYTSDFLNFTPTIERDFGLTLTSVAPTFATATGINKALKSFRTNASGQFSSDPAPVINGLAVVPEPGVWLLMVAGFGLVGVAARRRDALAMG